MLLLFIVSNCSSRTKAATELNIILLAIYFVDCEHYASWPSGKLKSLAGKFYHRGNPFLFQCELKIFLCTFAMVGMFGSLDIQTPPAEVRYLDPPKNIPMKHRTSGGTVDARNPKQPPGMYKTL